MANKKILVVDDEMNIVKLIASRLKANNYEVIVACDGLFAVKMAHEQKHDLIILDILMPAGNGLTVYKNLQDSIETAVIPVIFLTACASEEMRKQTLEMGAKDFVSKPFNAEDLLTKVKDVLGAADGEKRL